jgi:predicted transcriptional regulator
MAKKYIISLAYMIDTIEQRIQKIEQRNRRVEHDKAWEVSFVRRVLIFFFTYFAVAVYLWIIEVSRPFVNAIVPALAFMIATLTMPLFKQWWLQDFYSEKRSATLKKDNKKMHTKDTNGVEVKILQLFDEQSQITTRDVVELLNVSESTAWRYLDSLEKKGFITQKGDTGRGVFYKKNPS